MSSPMARAGSASASTLEAEATSACVPSLSCERCRGGDWPIGEEDREFLDYVHPNRNWHLMRHSIPDRKFIYIQTVDLVFSPFSILGLIWYWYQFNSSVSNIYIQTDP